MRLRSLSSARPDGATFRCRRSRGKRSRRDTGSGRGSPGNYPSSLLVGQVPDPRHETPKRSSRQSGRLIAIVDTGPLYAAVDADDQDHQLCVETLGRGDLQLVIPALVVAETAYLIGRRLGAGVEGAFLRTLAGFEVEPPTAEDWARMADLVEQYGDFPLGATDASCAVLAERLSTDVIVTLDVRHFGAIRRADGSPFQLLPR